MTLSWVTPNKKIGELPEFWKIQKPTTWLETGTLFQVIAYGQYNGGLNAAVLNNEPQDLKKKVKLSKEV